MYNLKMWIDGEFVDAESGKTYPVINPANGEEIGRLPLGDNAEVNKAVAAAKKAYPVWSKKSQAERNMVLGKFQEVLCDYAEELGMMESLDHGFPIKSAKHMGGAPGHFFQSACEQVNTLLGTVAPRRSSAVIYMQREPVGVCALITPWNVPLIMAASKLSICLATGNTCVLKPPSTDSLTTLKLAEALAKLDLPKGTVNIISGPGGTVGEALASHPDVRMVGFTGSSETGKRIMELGSSNVKRLALELGGKNPFIVLEDADLDAAVRSAVHSSYTNCGQICASPGRYYLHEKIHDEFVERFVAEAKKIVVGNPLDPSTQMGPVVNKEQRDKIEAYIKSGVDQGAKLVLGGKRPTNPPLDKGCFVMPTVFTDVTLDMTIAREEIFGPVACIMKSYSSEEQLLASVNDNVFGLGGSVWSKNTARAMRLAAEIETGAVWINEHLFLADGMPWGGVKESGLGRENSSFVVEEYTQVKTVYVDLTEMKQRPWNAL
ncbi:MAG: aldehyde dehydrogenase [Dehalococcoidales bacterium]|nr:aldehyde dehydrogenase [Dehalococcoidales bacterium]